MSGGVKKGKLATREARDAEHPLLRMTTALPKKEVFSPWRAGRSHESPTQMFFSRKNRKNRKNTDLPHYHPLQYFFFEHVCY